MIMETVNIIVNVCLTAKKYEVLHGGHGNEVWSGSLEGSADQSKTSITAVLLSVVMAILCVL